MRTSRASAPLLLLALAACGGASPPPGPPPSPEAPPPAAGPIAAPPPDSPPAKRSTLRYDVNGDHFPSPLVDAVVGGHPTTLLVDTGASHHVLAAWLARQLSLPGKVVKGGATDHGGHAIALSRVEGASLAIAGWGPVDARPLFVIETPEALQKLGIGGVLAPQALAADGRAVVMDLRRGTLREVPAGEAARVAGAFEGVRLCRPPGEGEGVRIVADAVVEGQAVHLLVDTGATHSSLHARSPVGRRLAGRAKSKSVGHAASGSYTVPTFEGARLGLGAFEAAVDLDILPTLPPSGCGSEGYLGMDVLKSCTLVMETDRVRAVCGA